MGSRRPTKYNPPASPPQLFLYSAIKKLYPDARLNYEIKTDRGHRYADIAVFSNGLDKTNFKIDVEYDGFISHKYRKKEDKERDMELKRAGWITIRVNKKNIGEVFKLIDEVINANIR